MMSSVSFIPAVFCLLFILTGTTDGSVESDLRAKLFRNHDSVSLPNTPTNVSMRFHILHIDIDEQRQELLIECFVSMEWFDYRLSWDEKEFPVPSITAPDKRVWTPDITVFNSLDLQNFNLFTSVPAVIFAGGKVMWVPTAKISASCILDLTYWPNDVQNCTIKFGSWAHSADTVDLYQKDDHVKTEIEDNGPWKLSSNSVTKVTSVYATHNYVSINVNMVLERVAPVYSLCIKLPAFGIAALPLLLFLLPPSSVEKVVTGVLIIILEVMFLGFTSSVLKQSSSHTPLLVELISEQFLLTLACVFVSCIIVRLAKDPSNSCMPSWMRQSVSLLTCICCLPGYRQLISKAARTGYPQSKTDIEMMEGRAMMNGHVHKMEKKQNFSGQVEWVALAAVLDRFFLVLYIILLIINYINYSILW